MRPQEWQSLSAYIDNQLSPREKAVLEKRLAKETDLQNALEDLRQTKILLHKLPIIRVPHNFTLSPEMVASQSPAIRGQLFPIFSLSSALATVLLVISIVFQWGIGASPLTMQAKMESADMVTAFEMTAEEASPPAIILWGEQNNSQGIVNGKGGGGDEPAPMAMNESPETFAIPMEDEPATAEGPIEEQLTAPEAEIPRGVKATPEPEYEAMEDAQPQLESLPVEESAPQTMQAAPQEPRSEQPTGEGPILGIPPKEEEGKIILPSEDLGASQPENRSIPTQLPLLQILLGILAVASGAAALFIHRKNLS